MKFYYPEYSWNGLFCNFKYQKLCKVTCQSKNYQVQKSFDLFFVLEIRVQRLFNSHAVEVRYCLGCRNEPVTKFVALKLLLESRKLAFALLKLAWTSQYGILYLYILFVIFYSKKNIQQFSRTRPREVTLFLANVSFLVIWKKNICEKYLPSLFY